MYRILEGDVTEQLKTLADESVDAIVTDPPYELSENSKTSPDRVVFEFMFPDYANGDVERMSESELLGFVRQILLLGCGGILPTKTTAMPVSAMALDKQSLLREVEIEDKCKPTSSVTEGDGAHNRNAEEDKGRSCLQLKLADPAHLFEILNEIGAGFDAGGIGIGFSLPSASLPTFLERSRIIRRVLDDIGMDADTFAKLVSTLRGTENKVMLRLDLSGAFVHDGSAIAALIFFALFEIAGAEFIRTTTRASCLSAKFKAAQFRVINPATHRAFAFDCLVHPTSISSKGFMGKGWDGSRVAFVVSTWQEALRVLKPGGYLLAFGGSRTYHRLACAVEDAGFEIRDQIAYFYSSDIERNDFLETLSSAQQESFLKAFGRPSILDWTYGSGFPKSLDVSKAIDKAAGAKREVAGYDASRSRPNRLYEGGAIGNIGGTGKISDRTDNGATQTTPATDAAMQWSGWGTALKPAHEPIVVARKPLVGTVAANVLQYGTGALNIDGCRVEYEGTPNPAANPLFRVEHGYRTQVGSDAAGSSFSIKPNGGNVTANALGRWPANVIHDGSEEVKEAFAQYGDHAAGQSNGEAQVGESSQGVVPPLRRGTLVSRTDTGSAARFFKSVEPDTREGEASAERVYKDSGSTNFAMKPGPRGGAPEGRWPANVIHDGSEEVLAAFPDAPGQLRAVDDGQRTQQNVYEKYGTDGHEWKPRNDAGSAARFFYCAKASREERNRGCEALDKKPLLWSSGTQSPGTFQAEGTDRSARNFHPTVKPIALMRYLCRLVTPPGGTVLDCFMGSGSTGIAALREGFNFIGVELNPEYVEIARARIEADAPLFNKAVVSGQPTVDSLVDRDKELSIKTAP